MYPWWNRDPFFLICKIPYPLRSHSSILITSFQVLVQGLSLWCLSSFQCVSERLRSIWALRLLQLYIYIIRISPATVFFFHPFLSYLSSNSPLGAERYDLWEDPRLKLPVQELWLSYFPITINIKPPKLVYRTLQHALTCIVSSLQHWYRTFRPHKTNSCTKRPLYSLLVVSFHGRNQPYAHRPSPLPCPVQAFVHLKHGSCVCG